MGCYEFYRLESNFNKRSLLLYLGVLFSVVLVLTPHLHDSILLPVLITSLVVASLLYLLYYHSRQENVFSKWAWMISGAVYTGWMLSYWIGLRLLVDGRIWVYLAMFIIFASDTGAFFVGRK